MLYVFRGSIGVIFGASAAVTQEVADTLIIFLVAIPFIAINRVTTASFYATEKSTSAYLLTYIEPAAMLVLMLILPAAFRRTDHDLVERHLRENPIGGSGIDLTVITKNEISCKVKIWSEILSALPDSRFSL